MLVSLREQAWEFVCAKFPERQVYIRSDGRVQFFTFNPLMQATLAGISLLFLGWVAFTSVNTIFKDRIIASKEENFRQMQGSYESRIASLQLSYDELNGAVVATEDHFRSVVEDLEGRHNTLASLIRGKEDLRAQLGLEAEPSAIHMDSVLNGTLDAGEEPHFTIFDTNAAPVPGSATEENAPENATPEETGTDVEGAGGPSHTFLEGTFRRLGSLFAGRPEPRPVDHPSLRQIAELETRLEHLVPVQRTLIAEAQKEMDREAAHYTETIRTAGLNPATLERRMLDAGGGGVGGPEMTISPAVLGYGDAEFGALALDAQASFEELRSVALALRAVPLNAPVTGNSFRQTSGFGARSDPFTKSLAFHGGIDFSGPWGSEVRATAPGKVVFAGSRGAYGTVVEVDHGFGLKTRYGHLSKILVTVGSEIEKGAVVGKLGSTGRSTGPHVHYEVWFDNELKNPSRFLRAGNYVNEE